MAIRGLRPVGAQEFPDVVTEQRASLLGAALELESVPRGDARRRRGPEKWEQLPVGVVCVRAPEHEHPVHPQELLGLRGRRLPSAQGLFEAAGRLRPAALAAAGIPRHPAEAPLEYVERALLSLEMSAEAVRRLTELFEWARFSHHEPEPSMRDDAVDALIAVRDELRASELVPA